MEDLNKEILKIQKENQEILKNIQKKTSEIADYFWWQKIFGTLRIIIFILILAGGIIYLPSIIDKTLNKTKQTILKELLPPQIQRN